MTKQEKAEQFLKIIVRNIERSENPPKENVWDFDDPRPNPKFKKGDLIIDPLSMAMMEFAAFNAIVTL